MDLKCSCSLFGVESVIFQNKFKLDCYGTYLRYYNNQTILRVIKVYSFICLYS